MAQPQQLILAFDLVNQTLVFFNGSAGALPQLRQGAYSVRIYIVQPVAGAIPGSTQYECIDATQYDGLRVGIWKASTGTEGDEDANLLALTDQLGWNYNVDDPDLPFFEGTFNARTDEIAEWMGAASCKAAYFAVNLVKGLDLYPVYDQRQGATNVTINSATDGGSPYSIIMTQGSPKLPVGCQIQGANGELWGFVADPNNDGNLLITRVN